MVGTAIDAEAACEESGLHFCHECLKLHACPCKEDVNAWLEKATALVAAWLCLVAAGGLRELVSLTWWRKRALHGLCSDVVEFL